MARQRRQRTEYTVCEPCCYICHKTRPSVREIFLYIAITRRRHRHHHQLYVSATPNVAHSMSISTEHRQYSLLLLLLTTNTKQQQQHQKLYLRFFLFPASLLITPNKMKKERKRKRGKNSAPPNLCVFFLLLLPLLRLVCWFHFDFCRAITNDFALLSCAFFLFLFRFVLVANRFG